MNWIVKTLAGAIVAGAGWKLGSDVYDTVKKRVKEYTEDKEQEDDNDGAGATTTHTVDVPSDSDDAPEAE
jgi:hypothetical protein